MDGLLSTTDDDFCYLTTRGRVSGLTPDGPQARREGLGQGPHVGFVEQSQVIAGDRVNRDAPGGQAAPAEQR